MRAPQFCQPHPLRHLRDFHTIIHFPLNSVQVSKALVPALSVGARIHLWLSSVFYSWRRGTPRLASIVWSFFFDLFPFPFFSAVVRSSCLMINSSFFLYRAVRDCLMYDRPVIETSKQAKERRDRASSSRAGCSVRTAGTRKTCGDDMACEAGFDTGELQMRVGIMEWARPLAPPSPWLATASHLSSVPFRSTP